MSAIAGLLNIDGRPVTPEVLARMVRAAPPRGGDGSRSWHSANAGLIRFAHAATPEAVGEVQPFIGPRAVTLLFDGRLDNRGEITGLLGNKGGDLTKAPDGALALALYQRFGREFVHRMAGDFAIAILEPALRKLSLFRSALGWRPLHWCMAGKTFSFATDPRTLVVGLGLERQLNEGALAEYLSARVLTQTETFWGNVHRVEQGGALILEDGRISHWLWHGGPFEDLTRLSMEDHAERFRHLFDQSLIAVNRSNGPVTSQLSGGLDSSSVVARSAQLYRGGLLEHPVGAISARFPGEPHDESDWSSAVEAHAGITAEVSSSRPFDLQAAQEWVAQSYHLPVKPNALDTLGGVLDIMAADGRRVLLTGEGGDDWLNGSTAHWPDLLRRGELQRLFAHGRLFWPGGMGAISMLKTLVIAARPLAVPRYRQALLQPALDWRIAEPDWVEPAWSTQTGLPDRWAGPPARHGLKGLAQRSRYTVFSHAMRNFTAQTALAYAESKGVEVRHPLHDLRLTRFYMGAAGNHMRDKEFRRKILREAMRQTLPEQVRMRTSKAMFVGHTVDAMNMILAERPAKQLLPVKLGWVKADRIEAIHEPFRQWRSAGSRGPVPELMLGPVWNCIAADMWLKHAFGM